MNLWKKNLYQERSGNSCFISARYFQAGICLTFNVAHIIKILLNTRVIIPLDFFLYPTQGKSQILTHAFRGRVRFGAAVSALDISAPDISASGPFGTTTFFFSFVFLQLRCFGLKLASLAVGLRTLVSTGSRSTAFKGIFSGGFFPGEFYPGTKSNASVVQYM